MSLIEAVLLVAGFGLIWLTLNLIIRELANRKQEIAKYVPVEYYGRDKGWWKKW